MQERGIFEGDWVRIVLSGTSGLVIIDAYPELLSSSNFLISSNP
jgi:hypothetical protein